MRRAEDCAEVREFTEEICEIIPVPDNDWPAGYGTRHFFDTDYVNYDPEADAAVFMEKMDRECREFRLQLAKARKT